MAAICAVIYQLLKFTTGSIMIAAACKILCCNTPKIETELEDNSLAGVEENRDGAQVACDQVLPPPSGLWSRAQRLEVSPV